MADYTYIKFWIIAFILARPSTTNTILCALFLSRFTCRDNLYQSQMILHILPLTFWLTVSIVVAACAAFCGFALPAFLVNLRCFPSPSLFSIFPFSPTATSSWVPSFPGAREVPALDPYHMNIVHIFHFSNIILHCCLIFTDVHKSHYRDNIFPHIYWRL